MDYKSFIIEAEKLSFTLIEETVRAVSWPIAAIVMVLMLRDPISKLIPLLRKLKYKDAEAVFSDQLDKAETVASIAFGAYGISGEFNRYLNPVRKTST